MTAKQGRIPQEVLDDIASRIDIVDVVGRYVPLTKRGANYMGLCPFHAEKTPSFSVSPDKQIFHCFGCGAGGNLYRFLMDIEGLSFPEAAKKLAREAGVALPQAQMTPAQAKAQAQKKRYLKIMGLAEKYYVHQWQTPEAQVYRDYVHQRGVSPQTLQAYGIGATSPGWDGLVAFLSRCKVPYADMEILGLGQKARQGKRVYDRFRDRLIFPIRDESGQTIGFGGRIVGQSDQPQKYLNSPETPLFHKSQVLYGLDLARSAIRKAKKVVITEGYMDVLACYQAGIGHVVAPMGTALTLDQVKSLMRYTYDFTLAFDGDRAGQGAALKALDVIESLGGRAQVLVLDADMDPDTLIQDQGPQAFALALDQARDAIDFRLDQALQGRNLETITDKMQVLDNLMDHLVSIRQRARLEMTIDKVAEALNLSRQAVLDEVTYGRRRSSGRSFAQQDPSPDKARDKAKPPTPQEEKEGLFLSLLFAQPDRFAQAEEGGGQALFATSLGDLYVWARDHYRETGHLSAAAMPPDWSHLLARILPLTQEDQEALRPDYFDRILTQMTWEGVNRRYADLVRLLGREDLSQEDLTKLMEEADRLIEEKTRLERCMRKEH